MVTEYWKQLKPVTFILSPKDGIHATVCGSAAESLRLALYLQFLFGLCYSIHCFTDQLRCSRSLMLLALDQRNPGVYTGKGPAKWLLCLCVSLNVNVH